MRKVLILIVFLGLVAGGGWYYWQHQSSGQSHGLYRTEEVVRGNLMASFTATGTLEPEDVIDVGAQVAGQIKEFGADMKSGKLIDYGSEVEAGTVLARIDDSLYKAKVEQSRAKVAEAKAAADQSDTKVEQAKANVGVAEANLGVAKANSDHAVKDYSRAQALGPTQAIAKADYDAFRQSYESTKASVKQAEASLNQAKAAVNDAIAAAAYARSVVADSEAALKQDEINLGYTTIKSPVKGVIIDRRVTIGQTVQSSFNTPSLFLIARDLKKMKVWASVNEADIGQVTLGQKVTFTVDARRGEVFQGVVGRVRLNATMTNNVVTYTVEVLTDNYDGRLLPYLTANLRFEVANRENVLTASNEALRWKPEIGQVAPDARAAYQKALQKHAGGSPEAAAGANKGVVWVQDGNFVRPVKVKIGLTDGARTEILSGDVQEGASIVTGDALTAGDDGGSNPFVSQAFGGKKQQ